MRIEYVLRQSQIVMRLSTAGTPRRTTPRALRLTLLCPRANSTRQNDFASLDLHGDPLRVALRGVLILRSARVTRGLMVIRLDRYAASCANFVLERVALG